MSCCLTKSFLCCRTHCSDVRDLAMAWVHNTHDAIPELSATGTSTVLELLSLCSCQVLYVVSTSAKHSSQDRVAIEHIDELP